MKPFIVDNDINESDEIFVQRVNQSPIYLKR